MHITEADYAAVIKRPEVLMELRPIYGAPRTKKNSSRVVKAGRFTKVLPSKAHEEWVKVALPQVIEDFCCFFYDCPLTCNVNIRAKFYREKLTGDAVGYYQALADLLEKAGVLVNDRQIVSWDGTRLLKDAKLPRIEVVIEKV